MVPEKHPTREYFEALLVAVLLATFVRTFVVQAFKIPTDSMEESLLIGDHILVNRFIFSPSNGRTVRPTPASFETMKGSSPSRRQAEAVTDVAFKTLRLLPQRQVRRGDVVIFQSPEEPGRTFVKRCVGVAGDRIEIIDKELHVNGERVADSGYASHRDSHTFAPSPLLKPDLGERDNFGPLTVPHDHVFVLGDNRDHSNDSRFWGPLPAASIRGRAFLVYWSFTLSTEAGETSGGRLGLQSLREAALNFFTHTRWHRTMELVR